MPDSPKHQIQLPHQGKVELDDIELAYTEWGQSYRGHGPTVIFVHATGFHARIWDQVIRQLPGRHIVSFDLRGHGASTGEAPDNWRIFAADVQQAVEKLDLENIVAVGHSIGGASVVSAIGIDASRYARAVLIDPVIFAPHKYRMRAATEKSAGPHFSSRRRRHFESPDAMFERFENREPYSLFDRAVLRDYCEHGLVATPDGKGLALACAPETEAKIYQTSASNANVYDCAMAINCPVLIVRANPGSSEPSTSFISSPTWPNLVDAFANGRELFWPHLTHFIPMQAPAAVADLIASEVDLESAPLA